MDMQWGWVEELSDGQIRQHVIHAENELQRLLAMDESTFDFETGEAVPDAIAAAKESLTVYQQVLRKRAGLTESGE